MSSIEVKTFDNPDESNTSFNNAKMDIVKIGDQRVMRLTLQPGWKWSQDIKPTVGTDSCKAKHLGVIVSGAVCAKHALHKLLPKLLHLNVLLYSYQFLPLV